MTNQLLGLTKLKAEYFDLIVNLFDDYIKKTSSNIKDESCLEIIGKYKEIFKKLQNHPLSKFDK